MKKVIALILAMVLIFALAACSASETTSTTEVGTAKAGDVDAVDASELKVGFIYIHDEQSTYDLNFMSGAKAACEKMGVQYLEKVGVPEDNECLTAAEELVDAGCTWIFADSFGHQPYMIEAAKEFPDCQFISATGDRAWTEGLSNFHNAFADIYHGRYLAGIVAGMKLNEMIENGEITADEAKIGYVGAKPYAEVYSGFTSFFLGARSVCESATMEVIFTGSWYDETAEKEGAELLISRGAKLISQHADSMGAPTACETAGVPNVSYNGSTIDACPNTFLVSSRINWEPYFTHMIECALNGDTLETDYCGTLEGGSVELTAINEDVCAAGTQEAIDEAWDKLVNDEIYVYDTAAFTVTNKEYGWANPLAETDADGHVTSYLADVEFDDAYTHDTDVIVDGHFDESSLRSAPYFDLLIDGITVLE